MVEDNSGGLGLVPNGERDEGAAIQKNERITVFILPAIVQQGAGGAEGEGTPNQP